MKRLFVSFMMILGLVSFLAGCAEMQRTEDASTNSIIKGRLAADNNIHLSQVGVDTADGTVYLSGIVPTSEQRMRAEQIARNVHGVRGVVNNLQIAAPVVPVVEDPVITSSIKNRLAADRMTSLARINVDTTAGTVYLNGTVSMPEQRIRAEQLAYEVRGVNRVINNLQVASVP